jgi:hypothetical protein
MSSGVAREIVYEDDEFIAYADYELAGRIYSEKPVDLFVVNKQETNGNDYEKI